MQKYKELLIAIPFLGRRYFLPWIIKREGGQQQSNTLRELAYKRYKVNVGMHSYGSCFDAYFNTGGSVEIGRYCSFGPSIRYFGANHPMQYATMSPYFYQQKWAGGGTTVTDIERNHLKIGHDVWIGYGTVITANCHSIGNGAVIGAGSIITKDVEPYSIVAGNPAHLIRYRFDYETIEKLEESRWFLLEPQFLLHYYNLIDNPMLWSEEIIGGGFEKHEGDKL